MAIAHSSLHAGEQAFQRNDFARAAKEFRPLAQQGNATAQYYIARMYHEGRGLPENNVEAFPWALKAAEQGHGDAEALVGLLYAQGQGLARDDEEAVRWLHKAAARGIPAGQMKMGMCYLNGIGVNQDYMRAYMWFDLAASRTKGHDYRCNCSMRDDLASAHLTPAQIAQAKQMAREWKPQHNPLLERLHLA